MKRTRFLLGLLFVAASSIAGIGLDSGAASAAGGGCRPVSSEGWDISVCSSDNGVHVFGDVYINRRGSTPPGAYTCRITYQLADITGTVHQWVGNRATHYSCDVGHYGSVNAIKGPGRSYQNVAEVQINRGAGWEFVVGGGSKVTT